MIRFLPTAFCVALSFALVPSAGARDEASAKAAELSKRINIAGRQRMLVQRIARATCFKLAGLDAERHEDIAAGAIGQFESAQDLLRNGDVEKGFSAETDPVALGHLDRVDELWITLGAANRQILADDILRVVVVQIVELTNPAMSAANDVVSALVAQGGGAGGLDPALAKTINLAGRQRMLSQRAAKEFCLANLGIERKTNLSQLQGTVQLFENTLKDLERGENGLVSPPNGLVAIRLRWVRTSWDRLMPLYDRVLAGEVLTDEDAVTLATLSDDVLKNMNEAVGGYTLSN